MRIRIRPYSKGSASAKRLTTAIGGKKLRVEGSKFSPRKGDLVINWGNKQPFTPQVNPIVLNHPTTIPPNKLAFYKAHVNLVPPFTESRDQAVAWITADKKKVVCRTMLNASGGAGIVIAENVPDLVNSSVYTQYIPKMSEFRLHFVGDSIIFSQQKKMRSGIEDANFQVRNHENGFVYCHLDIEVPWEVIEICEEFVDRTSLDFGAIDVIYNKKHSKAYILEVNTAPGLEGDTTLERYVEAFKKLIARGFTVE